MDELEGALSALVEQRRTPGIPVGMIRRMIDARGFGDCACRSYMEAMKENR
jgi:hypothetical protein